jgi:hypothetical protein
MGWRWATLIEWEHGAEPTDKHWGSIVEFLNYDPREKEREAAD